MTLLKSLATLGALVLSSAAVAIPVTISPAFTLNTPVWAGVDQYFTFDDSAFPDFMLSNSLESDDVKGSGTMLGAINDGRLTRYLDPDYAEDWFTLGWDAPIYNNAGADFAVFELWAPESIRVATNSGGPWVDYTPMYTGYSFSFSNGATARINMALIDLSDLGVMAGDSVTSLALAGTGSLSTSINDADGSPEIAVIGALTRSLSPEPVAVSEPNPLPLMALGLGFIAIATRAKRLAK